MVSQLLAESEFSLLPADDLDSAFELLRRESFHAVVANFHEPGVDPVWFYKEATSLQPGIKGRFLYVTDNFGVMRRLLNECPVLMPPLGRENLCHALSACPAEV